MQSLREIADQRWNSPSLRSIGGRSENSLNIVSAIEYQEPTGSARIHEPLVDKFQCDPKQQMALYPSIKQMLKPLA